MATKSRATQCGEYVCKVGDYDIRHKIVQPKKIKNFKGDIVKTPGSVVAGVYFGSDLVKCEFNDHSKAVEYIWRRLKNNKKHEMVSKKIIKKYNLT